MPVTPRKKFLKPRELSGTPLARQGYVPDLEPLLGSYSDLGRALLPQSRSSPQLSPTQASISDSASPIGPIVPPMYHTSRAGVVLAASPVPDATILPSIHYNNLWGTVCSMCSATLGAGALSLPYAFKQLGIVNGLLLLLITAAASHYSVVLLTSSISAMGARSYEELTVSLFGKGMGVLVELNIIVFCFGSAVAYTIALGDLLHPLTSEFLSRRAVISTVWLVVLLPLSFSERLSALQCASAFGVLAVVYLVLSVVAHMSLCAFFSPHDDQLADFGAATAAAAGSSSAASPPVPPPRLPAAGDADGVQLWTWHAASFEALAVMMFAFTCQVNVPSLYDELKERSLPRMRRVSARAIGICLACYAAVGVAGYADAPASVSGNLLNNYCVSLHPGASEHPSHLMLPAYVAMASSVLMAYPLNILPCRYTLDVMCCQQFGARRSLVRHCVWTVCVAGAGLLVSLYVPAINVVFQLMGSTSSALVCFVLPAAFGLKLRVPEARGRLGTAGCIALLVGGGAVGAIATTVTVVGLMHRAPHADPSQLAPHVQACQRQCQF